MKPKPKLQSLFGYMWSDRLSMPDLVRTVFEDLENFALIDKISRDYQAFYDKILLTDVQQTYGLTRRGLRIIHAMYTEGGRIDKASLASLVGLDAAPLQRTLIDLIGRGLIKTEIKSDTAIQTVITLTASGRQACEFALSKIKTLPIDSSTETSLTLTDSERLEIVRMLLTLESRAKVLKNAL